MGSETGVFNEATHQRRQRAGIADREVAVVAGMSFTESQIALFTLTEDAKEGQKAFQEKRKPLWTGK